MLVSPHRPATGSGTSWRAAREKLGDGDLRAKQRTRWPFKGRPFGDIIAWANLELMKNAAEIGYARFLYAQRFEDRAAGK